MRADSSDAFQRVVDAIPDEVGGATLHPGMVRLWPGMDSTEATVPLLERAGAALGRPVVGMPRGGASDASHFAASIPLTVDGLGPRGGAAHNPEEFIARRVAGAARGGRARARDARRSVRTVTASDSSSRGRSITISSPRLPSRRIADHAALLEVDAARRSGRGRPARTTARGRRRARARRRRGGRRSSSASSRSKPLAEHVLLLGLDVERLARQPGGVGARAASGSCRPPRTPGRAAPARRRPPRTGARRGRSARGRRHRPWSRAARPRRAGGARAAGPWRGA